jgi:hypothetical protein
MPYFRSLAVRVTAGACLGALAWPALHAVLPRLPEAARFVLGYALFAFGPGVAIAGAVSRALDPLQRVIVVVGAGGAAAAALVNLLGHADLVPAFPYIAAACTGAGLAAWRGREPGREGARTPRGDAAACAFLVVLAAVVGATVFGHRLAIAPDGIRLFGDYDTADIAYYAAVASEASHTVPPTASYYSGHKLNAAYYPHLVPAMIHRFCDVPILSIFFRYGWPAYVVLTSLTAFVLVRTLASRGTALLAVVFIVLGSDFSYLAAWFLPHDTVDWDYLLWPTNFLSPTMQVQHFSTWSPSLPVFFTALVAIVRSLQTRAAGWTLLGGLLIGILFEFKPFAYIVLMAALSAAFVFPRGDWRVLGADAMANAARWRYAAAIGLGVLFSLPSLWGAATIAPEDRRSRLVADLLPLVDRMVIKTGLADAFARAAERVAPLASLRTAAFLAMATVVFFAIGIGVRWLGLPGVWRAIRARDADGDAASWRLLGWVVVAGIAIPLVIATEPYIDTLQFYLTGLYILWIFTAAALVRFAATRPKAGALAIAAALALAFPASGHYLAWKWTEQQRPPRVMLTRSEVAIARYLRFFDPHSTVVLHDRPLAPSLTTIVAARRIVLGWDVKYSAVGGEDRLSDVNRFFSSIETGPEVALEVLRKYQVTHVIVRFPHDRVHPAVLDRLEAVLKYPDAVLYQVPSPL